MIIDLRQPAGASHEEMAGPFLRRRRARKARKAEQAAEIEAATTRMLEGAYDGLNVADVTYGADVSTGTHEGNPELARMRIEAASRGGMPMWPIVAGGGLVLFLVMRKKKE